MSSMGGLDRALGMMGHSVEDAGPVVPQQAVRQMSASEKKKQVADAFDFLGQFGGPVPDKKGARLRAATFADLAAPRGPGVLALLVSQRRPEPFLRTLVQHYNDVIWCIVFRLGQIECIFYDF